MRVLTMLLLRSCCYFRHLRHGEGEHGVGDWSGTTISLDLDVAQYSK